MSWRRRAAHSTAATSDSPAAAAQQPFRLEQLPDAVIDLICSRASRSRTPASCLLALVSPSWGAAASSSQQGATIDVHLGRFLETPWVPLVPRRRTRQGTRQAAAAAGGTAGRPNAPPLLPAAAGSRQAPHVSSSSRLLARAAADAARLDSLATWLRRPGRMPQALCIKWAEQTHSFDMVVVPAATMHNFFFGYRKGLAAVLVALQAAAMRSRKAAAAAAAAAGDDDDDDGATACSSRSSSVGCLLQLELELPVMDAPLLSKAADTLVACGQHLQHLHLDVDLNAQHGKGATQPAALDGLYAALRQLPQLIRLELHLRSLIEIRLVPLELLPLVAACPASLQELVLRAGLLHSFRDDLQLGTLCHLRHLRRLQLPRIAVGASQQEQQLVQESLTALTAVCALSVLKDEAAPLLELPALRAVCCAVYTPVAAELARLEARTHITCLACEPPHDLHDIRAVGRLTHLQRLELIPPVSWPAEHAPALLDVFRALTQLRGLVLLPYMPQQMGVLQMLQALSQLQRLTFAVGSAARAQLKPQAVTRKVAALLAPEQGQQLPFPPLQQPGQQQQHVLQQQQLAQEQHTPQEQQQQQLLLLVRLQQLQLLRVAFDQEVSADEAAAAADELRVQLPGVKVEVCGRGDWSMMGFIDLEG